MQCQYTAPYYRPESQTSPDSGWAMDAQDPLLRKQGTTRNSHHTTGGGILTASNMRQWAAARGYNLLPVNTLQKYFKRVDLQKTVSHHIPFKISFGATMGLAAFAQF
ncbi:Multicopper oxidase family protein [Aspergillus niger]|uniref:Multicopper oxidase family protein n=1 Tax=Aspergillus niger TaxID=5061 RepID=A0A505HRC8_ASPNG|nr:Multicopper oxidase family protein [Aspergillus niger]